MGKYKDIPLKAVNKSGTMDDFLTEDEKKQAKEKGSAVTEKLKKALGDRVKEVVVSTRLTDVSAVVVTDENDPSVQMQQLLIEMRKLFKKAKTLKPKACRVDSFETYLIGLDKN